VAQGKAEPVDVTGYAVSDAVKLIRGSEKGSEVNAYYQKVDGSIKVIVLVKG
jgi:carboxyl-terminal processing protease